MEQIFVESSKSYKHGFILKEQDLRRIIDLMNEQFKKLSTEVIEYNFVLKYKNGAVANTNDIESVLKQDNEGSASIVRLQINGSQINDDKASFIKLEFRHPDTAEDESNVPIKHLIKGQSRDWVFVTSSLIEERITKIKRSQIDPTSSNSPEKLLFRLSTPIIMLTFLISMIVYLPETSNTLNMQKFKAISEIEAKWKAHSILDPIDVIIQLEKAKNKPENNITINTIMFSLILSRPFIIVIGGLIILIVLLNVLLKYYPVYNFYWGSYIEIFDKKESTRKLIIGILLGTIFLGIIVNLLSNIIWDKL